MTKETFILVTFLIGMGLLAGCDSKGKGNSKTPLITIQTRKAEQPHIEGQAFIKTFDGVNPLAGIQVHVYPPTIQKQFETMKDASTTAKALIPQSKAKLHDLQQKIRDYNQKKDHYDDAHEKANQWRQMLDTLEFKTKDFVENRYETFSYYHPLYQRQVTVNWSKKTIAWDAWHQNVQQELLTLVKKTKIRVDQAKAMEQSCYEAVTSLPIKDYFSQESRVKEELNRHQQNQLKIYQIVDVIMNTRKPLEKLYADDQGHFDCNIDPGTYLVLASWDMEGSYYTWMEPVEVEENEEGEVILAVTNAHSVEK